MSSYSVEWNVQNGNYLAQNRNEKKKQKQYQIQNETQRSLPIQRGNCNLVVAVLLLYVSIQMKGNT